MKTYIELEWNRIKHDAHNPFCRKVITTNIMHLLIQELNLKSTYKMLENLRKVKMAKFLNFPIMNSKPW